MRAAVRFAAERARARDRLRRGARGDRSGRRRGRPRGAASRLVVADDDVARGKPDPESYLLALEALGVDRRGDALVFEDTEAGVASAKAAGTRVVAVARNAAARAARRGRRGGRGDRRPVAAAPARMTWAIAHRGASAELPENTLAAFERAIELGADFVELDVHAAAGRLARRLPRPAARRRAAPRGGGRAAARAGSGSCASSRAPWRYRRHDVVARVERLLPEDAVVVCFEPRALQQVRRPAHASSTSASASRSAAPRATPGRSASGTRASGRRGIELARAAWA